MPHHDDHQSSEDDCTEDRRTAKKKEEIFVEGTAATENPSMSGATAPNTPDHYLQDKNEPTNTSRKAKSSNSLDLVITAMIQRKNDEPYSWPQSSSSPSYFATMWAEFVQSAHQPVLKVLHQITHMAAQNPKWTVSTVVIVSLLLFIFGFIFNFHLVLDEVVLWSPMGSYPVRHKDWIDNVSGFPAQPLFLQLFFHANGHNILGKEPVAQVFQAVDKFRSVPGYTSICQANHADMDGSPCRVFGILSFWNNSFSVFNEMVRTDEDAIRDMSALSFPDGRPVTQDRLFGYPEWSAGGMLVSLQSYTVTWLLPNVPKVMEFEIQAVQTILDWRLNNESELLQMEVYSSSSSFEETRRATMKDIPLVPVVFVTMSIFVCLIFGRRHKVYSRCLLGFGAVITVLMSILSGFGLMFFCDVPFSTITQLVLFVVFGVGMDDAIILVTTYQRTDCKMDPVKRVADTIKEIGISITLTTLTSAIAFALGCLSSVPAVVWLCIYAVVSIILVLLYQLTMFVALIVLDEHRIMERRHDCCFCCKHVQIRLDNSAEHGSGSTIDTIDRDDDGDRNNQGPKEYIVDRIMGWYAQKLLHPWVKSVVMTAFVSFFILCAFSASQLTVDFKQRDVFPADSYIIVFFDAINEYTKRGRISIGVYFRYVDQSDHQVQAQMESYVHDLTALDIVQSAPEAFWLTDFRRFVNETDEVTLPQTFQEQLALFLSDPVFDELYGNDIVHNGSFDVIASRTFLTLDVNVEDAQEGMNALEAQQKITQEHSANQSQTDFAFFTYHDNYNFWEFYVACIRELILATTLAVAAMVCVALVAIPHWSAALFVFAMLLSCYVDLLGVMRWGKLNIDPMTYIMVVVSIGLLVDYIMHIFLRYFQSWARNRREKTVSTLQTMGASILTGGCTTFLGVLPLAFSTFKGFHTVFVAFLGIVTLGVGHGLVLLPVLLSMIGPESQSETRFEV